MQIRSPRLEVQKIKEDHAASLGLTIYVDLQLSRGNRPWLRFLHSKRVERGPPHETAHDPDRGRSIWSSRKMRTDASAVVGLLWRTPAWMET